ncbi:MAG: hypothetical protein WA823_20680 [Candidatus Acidiferrales bacterium]
MTIKSDVSTLKIPAPSQPSAADFSAQWTQARLAYPLYAALATQFNLAQLPNPAGELPPIRPTREIFDAVLNFLAAVDEKVRAYQIRQLPPATLNASEESLRAFLQRQLRKTDKVVADRDKIDLLVVQYFALCAPEDLYRKDIRLEDVALVLKPVLPDANGKRLEICEQLDPILQKISQCESLRDMMEHGLLEQGRLLKESAGAQFYDPHALVAFCRFNFLLRRAFIRMLHADVTAVRHAAIQLEAAGVKTVDCRRAGFSAAETTTQLIYYCENWKQPFHKDYTESSVNRAFEQLLALRADLEEAVGRLNPAAGSTGAAAIAHQAAKVVVGSEQSTATVPPPAANVQVAPSNAPAPKRADGASANGTPAPKLPVAAPKPPAVNAASSDSSATPTATAEMEKCLEAIWEQLIAAPPSRGRSMSTVVLQDTKVLLSSWEVAAFVTEGDTEAEDLRRAVVARALLALGTDQRKRSGDVAQLASALALAKSEASYFQGRVEAAKRAKNTEAAVNLGISTKRLLSFIEEAEKLQP